MDKILASNQKKAKSLIDEGSIGRVKLLQGDFGFDIGDDYPVEGRAINKELGGGALLDVGIYPISFAYHIFGKDPIDIKASMVPAVTGGVDAISSYIFNYGDAMAVMMSAVWAQTEHTIYIAGEKGSITIPSFWCADKITLKLFEGEEKTFEFARESRGYNYEIEAVNDNLRQGEKVNEIMSPDVSLTIMKTLDKIVSLY